MSKHLKDAVASLGYTEEQVLSSRETEDSVIIVIDNGIAGCPKYIIAKADIKPVGAPKAEPATKKAPSRKDNT